MTVMTAPLWHFYFNQVDWAFNHGCSSHACHSGSIGVGTEHTVIVEVDQGTRLSHDLPIRRYHPGCAPLHPVDPDEHLEPGLGVDS